MDKTGMLWAPCLEWSVRNRSWSSNPFDLVATATFEHESSGARHITEMFYTGDDVWKFRFTGTRIGKWSLATSSSDAELAGKRGTVTVRANPDPNIEGFLTHVGNKYAIQTGDEKDMRGYLFNVYMNRTKYDVFASPKQLGDNWLEHPLFKFSDERIEAYLQDARDNGFEVAFVHPAYPLVWTDGEDPRQELFEALERMIMRAHGQGMRVHIWLWADGQRKGTPEHGGLGGINGARDRRLQRYIAARLGPLPGWTMGYGFDLHEWTNGGNLNGWASYMHEHFGWQHLLCARGFTLVGPSSVNSYDGFGRNVPLTTTKHGPRDYHEIVEDMEGDLTRPHLYEERHSYRRRGFDLDMDGTRRLLWRQAMAGGMGGFYGFYSNESSAFNGHPYPNPEQLRTHHKFWHIKKRFLLGMRRANELTEKGGFVLTDSTNRHYVFYREDASYITMDLSGMEHLQNAVAVDTRKAYAELVLGGLSPAVRKWQAPYRSDWAIAVGIGETATAPSVADSLAKTQNRGNHDR